MSDDAREALKHEAFRVSEAWKALDQSTQEGEEEGRRLKERYYELEREYKRLGKAGSTDDLPAAPVASRPGKPRADRTEGDAPQKPAIKVNLPGRDVSVAAGALLLSFVALILAYAPYTGLIAAPLAIIALVIGAFGRGRWSVKAGLVVIAGVTLAVSSVHWFTLFGVEPALFDVSDELPETERRSIDTLAPAPEISAPSAALSEPGSEPDPALATLSEFDQIQVGMPYQQVAGLIGSDGELTYENTIRGVRGVTEAVETRMYSWKGAGGPGASMSAIFENGELTVKSQLGLK